MSKRPFPYSRPEITRNIFVNLFSGMFIFLLMLAGCKQDNNKDALELERQRADSLLQASIENRKRLETEEELAERVRRLKNKGFTSNDSVYAAAIVSPLNDSLLAAIELSGKSNAGGKLKRFTHTAIAVDGAIVRGVLPGTLFRWERPDERRYTLYSITEETGEVNANLLDAGKDSLYFVPTLPLGNYYFELLRQYAFDPEPGYPDQYFNTIKSARIQNCIISDSLYPDSEAYRDDRALFPEFTDPPATRIWVRTNREVKNILVTRVTDSTANTITLSGKREEQGVIARIRSRFVNDTLFRQFLIRDSLVYDHPHLVVYQKDSVIRNFRYNKDFEFTLLSSDTLKTIRNYPQYYPELRDSTFQVATDTFALNGKSVSWKYHLSYSRGMSNPGKAPVRVVHKDLTDASGNQLIFRLPRAGTPVTAQLTDLLRPEKYYREEDLNFDGYTDFSFRKGADNNGNPEYMVYLYNPNYGRFSRTPQLDGISVYDGIVTDKIKNRLLYPGSIGGGHLSVSIITTDNGAVKQKEVYWTTGKAEAPQLHYQKMMNNSIVEKRSPLIDSLPVHGKDLKTGLVQWILEKG